MTKIEQYKAAEQLLNSLREEVCKSHTINELLDADLKVLAIKKFRDRTGCSLTEAKENIDALIEARQAKPGITNLGQLLRQKLNVA